ncbi:hypothetical protein BC332_05510 [Capsicum chinense]|nr:hypothetical protein BC332_05510 [Capsicum chinense]
MSKNCVTTKGCGSVDEVSIKRLSKMQALTFTVKGNVGFGFQNRQILQGVCDLRRRNLAGENLRMTERNSCFGVNMDSASMGIELGAKRF